MKKNIFRTIGSVLTISVFMFLALGSDEEFEQAMEEAQTESASTEEMDETEETTTEEIEEDSSPSLEYKIGQKITADVFENNENGLKTYLRFEGSDGSGGMFGSLTLANNATTCKYVYTYSISGNTIETEFLGSDCGASSSDQTYTYNESSNTISCYIGGQKFVFSSIF